ncbi:diguanylate cyclase (GGDEF domain) with PAS/PAC sensor [Paramagnetospirillum magnetotacticum MS-1]|uniref:diguanylate cyclase n=1 Tax=Paramagnetospirillum magnetotacticum MS-1 TaxID=272627 RepID=A0A0C2YJK2_PARME|nr:diguanylate cyclase [Paramagnetospirillum magnetotacticum]KIL99954.1 diguanylate cyclase (GGDEF domain) with PAS/PAC sensor [Paramagnetospirillum magnetotacticum MS-1]
MSKSADDKVKLTLRRAESRPEADGNATWPVLVVDDDPDVHSMTRVLLRDFSFQGKGFEVISAMSGAEARTVLSTRDDIPVMLLDVVMETPDAGLSLIRHVRDDLGNRRLAIVLRTGQPGEAPERDVMLAYDINDYRSKTELTAQKLFTSLIGGLRSWIHLSTIEAMASNLERRVEERTCQLDEARRFAESLVETLPNPLWFTDPDGSLRLYNRAFREMFAVDGTDWHGQPAHSVLPQPLAGLDQLADMSLKAGGPGGLAFEASLDRPGDPRTLVVNKAMVISDCRGMPDEPMGTIGIVTDITERKRMESQLRHLATTDELTGCLNRRAFFVVAEQELERASRYGGSVSVLMIDIDHFKQVNDRHGHAVGDRALKAATAAIRANLREIDSFGRLGGEEFAAMLPETPLAGALLVAERLREAVAAIVLPLGENEAPLRLTTSLGVAERRAEETSLDQILARADTALYRAKAEGRNRVLA